jgi:ribosomal protein S18 acetylase RimI-like enzyme
MTDAPVLRSLGASDRGLLRTATFLNMNWTGEQRFTYRDIDRARELRHYYGFCACRGDFGFVAESGGVTVGVVWLLFLDSGDPGFGFVDEGVPELGIAVWPGYRGRGIGRSLIAAALREAGARGLARVSLSVEQGNPALGLYRSVGFERAEGCPEDTWVLNPTETP